MRIVAMLQPMAGGESDSCRLPMARSVNGCESLRGEFIMVAMAGCSGSRLAQKLGIKPGITVTVLGAPGNYGQLVGSAAKTVTFSKAQGSNLLFIHLFVTDRSELEKALRLLRPRLADAGTLWVSWPKKASRVATDVTEDVVRAVALPLQLVDVKVCAVDEIWSGLKLVIRRKHRAATGGK
jgi:hypothetical protein